MTVWGIEACGKTKSSSLLCPGVRWFIFASFFSWDIRLIFFTVSHLHFFSLPSLFLISSIWLMQSLWVAISWDAWMLYAFPKTWLVTVWTTVLMKAMKLHIHSVTVSLFTSLMMPWIQSVCVSCVESLIEWLQMIHFIHCSERVFIPIAVIRSPRTHFHFPVFLSLCIITAPEEAETTVIFGVDFNIFVGIVLSIFVVCLIFIVNLIICLCRSNQLQQQHRVALHGQSTTTLAHPISFNGKIMIVGWQYITHSRRKNQLLEPGLMMSPAAARYATLPLDKLRDKPPPPSYPSPYAHHSNGPTNNLVPGHHMIVTDNGTNGAIPQVVYYTTKRDGGHVLTWNTCRCRSNVKTVCWCQRVLLVKDSHSNTKRSTKSLSSREHQHMKFSYVLFTSLSDIPFIASFR